ncbi:uncharacterized protein DC041_0003985 [Schistosoma bovis]|uniref:Inositol 1,4,5-trisphosphate/ryanodine receptor domain-containing protein n=1 Tax=Schistosoma bovis TaxID=6184 RepID=A0A430QFW3_SCHBO|nr:uncharacterized protein DC041_0003985 [Schistosoma bovis]
MLCRLLQTVHIKIKTQFNQSLVTCRKSEACWWTIHPASKQRSVGEKVRIGDDLILVSVSSERYLVSVL